MSLVCYGNIKSVKWRAEGWNCGQAISRSAGLCTSRWHAQTYMYENFSLLLSNNFGTFGRSRLQKMPVNVKQPVWVSFVLKALRCSKNIGNFLRYNLHNLIMSIHLFFFFLLSFFQPYFLSILLSSPTLDLKSLSSHFSRLWNYNWSATEVSELITL